MGISVISKDTDDTPTKHAKRKTLRFHITLPRDNKKILATPM